jgi:PKHD-type hydroxylase
MNEEPVYAWWEFPSAVDNETIDKILDSTGKEWEEGLTYDKDRSVRKTKVMFKNDQWLYDYFWPYMESANINAMWNLHISICEQMQIGLYPPGGHYDFHIDGNGFDKINSNNNLDGTTRKISMVCWLNDDYEGGEFVFWEGQHTPLKPPKGTIMFFPSWTMHKVNPVTKGERYSLVAWFRGNPVI